MPPDVSGITKLATFGRTVNIVPAKPSLQPMVLFLTQNTVKCIFHECFVITSQLNTQWMASQSIVLHKLHPTS